MDPSETLVVIAVLLGLILVELGAILVRVGKQNELQTKANEQLAYQSARLHELVNAANLPERPGSTH